MSKSSMILLAGRYRSGADEIVYPAANRLLSHCDAVLRLAGDSKVADENVRLAEAQGLPGDHKLDDIARAVS